MIGSCHFGNAQLVYSLGYKLKNSYISKNLLSQPRLSPDQPRIVYLSANLPQLNGLISHSWTPSGAVGGHALFWPEVARPVRRHYGIHVR
jgi:hypothetical protein